MTRKHSLYLSVAATCLPAALSDPAACRVQGPNQKERHQERGDEPERAGIMSEVIAETHNLPSRNANAAVIDDQGRYSCPICRRPNIKYTVWVRGEHRSRAGASKPKRAGHNDWINPCFCHPIPLRRHSDAMSDYSGLRETPVFYRSLEYIIFRVTSRGSARPPQHVERNENLPDLANDCLDFLTLQVLVLVPYAPNEIGPNHAKAPLGRDLAGIR
jgi:hypothetical protein